jgi:hypothetical protein
MFDNCKQKKAIGWSRSFDGTTFNPIVTRSGVSQSDISQKFSKAIWQATNGTARLEEARQRTYSFQEDGGVYSYYNPALDFEGAYSLSYTVTSYLGSYTLTGSN